ncbi:hypothetical protein BFP71_11790 [Roseivirga misakiensis]|uniref:DUF4221 domain-containing protein n=2 Tax=Roseivirga misakiensis TaxID=1563681 RepID=A0A1E5SYG8_9BACT|nr:hypothetical protein BFP71_11790 [Roseivirga misakiensis]
MLLLVLIVISLGCKSEIGKGLIVYDSFQVNDVLTHQVHKISEPLSPSRIDIIDSLVLMIDYKMEHAFHFYKISDWSYLGGFGKVGDGPDEVKMPRFHGQFVKKNDETFFWVSDFRTYDLKKINLYDLLATGDAVPKVRLKLPPVLTWTYNDIYAISDEEFIGTVEGDVSKEALGVESGRFFSYKSQGDTVTWLPNWPIQETEVDAEKIGYLYSSFSSFNSSTNQVVSSMKFYDRIDLVDVINNSVSTLIQNGNESIKEVDLKDDRYLIPPNAMNYNGFNYATTNYIYQLYNKFSESDSKDFFAGRQNAIPMYELRVFDWSGKAIYKATLDKRRLGRFFVDENTWTMYVINNGREQEEDLIISYQLKDLSLID